eukprot:scaffold26424_cov19-Tisochrysis_lutea.AAC.2
MRTDVLRLPGQSKECPLACSVLNDFCGALLNVGRVPDFYTTTITQSENPEAAAESSAPAQLKDALLLHQTIGGCLVIPCCCSGAKCHSPAAQWGSSFYKLPPTQHTRKHAAAHNTHLQACSHEYLQRPAAQWGSRRAVPTLSWLLSVLVLDATSLCSLGIHGESVMKQLVKCAGAN